MPAGIMESDIAATGLSTLADSGFPPANVDPDLPVGHFVSIPTMTHHGNVLHEPFLGDTVPGEPLIWE